MDATVPTRPSRNRLLPYWAVFQTDFWATFNSWLYRFWILLAVSVLGGYLLYRFGAMRVAGMLQGAPEALGDMLQWVVYGTITLIIAMTAGTISSEGGTMADSVLSRGISRYQYFMGKWHSRLVLVLGTFLVTSSAAMVGGYFMLHSDALTLHGGFVAILIVASMLLFVVTFAVSVSAMSSNTLVSIAVVWVTLYGGGFLLTQLPSTIPSPERTLHNLPNVMKGYYDWNSLGRTMLISLGVSAGTALVGMITFSRRDV